IRSQGCVLSPRRPSAADTPSEYLRELYAARGAAAIAGVGTTLVPELPFGNAVRETPVSHAVPGPDAKQEFRGMHSRTEFGDEGHGRRRRGGIPNCAPNPFPGMVLLQGRPRPSRGPS